MLALPSQQQSTGQTFWKSKFLTDVMLLGGCGKSMENQRKMNVKLLILYDLALIIFMTVMCNHKPCRNCHCFLRGFGSRRCLRSFRVESFEIWSFEVNVDEIMALVIDALRQLRAPSGS